MINRQNDRKTENPCREAILVKMKDIINGDLKMICNKYSNQLIISDINISNEYITTNRIGIYIYKVAQ